MNRENNAQKLLHSIMYALADIIYNGKPLEDIDRIAVKMFPRGSRQDLRCCIYKGRAIVRYRLLAMLGYDISKEEDELKALASYAEEVKTQSENNEPVLTVIDEACSSCIRQNYFVTDACRGCLARPCTVCPKGAISISNGKSLIDGEKCVNCGLCERVCPYNAIVNIPVPCEKACPVKAVSKDDNNRVIIDHKSCILSGRCLASCPFGAIMERSNLIDVIRLIRSGAEVSALLAPAIAGQFDAPFNRIAGALKLLGFTHLAEAAAGADLTTQEEAEELTERLSHGEAFMTTSCCPAWVSAAKAQIPEIVPFISTTPSPMIFTAKMSKDRWPDAKTVFIGPCIAKRKEASASGVVDYVLTFEELNILLKAASIDPKTAEPVRCEIEGSGAGRGFAVSGGAAKAVIARAGGIEITPFAINGLSAKEIRVLAGYPQSKTPGNFCEVMACEGGCAAGPESIENSVAATKRIAAHAAET